MKDLKNYTKQVKDLMELNEEDLMDYEDGNNESMYLIRSHFEQAARLCRDALNHIWVMENNEEEN